MRFDYDYFLVVAEKESITKAAQQLFVSPQNISAYIKRLEQHVGTELFCRKPTFKLNENGKELYQTVKRMQQLEDSAYSEISQKGSGEKGTIRLGIEETRGQALLHAVYGDYHRQYPDVSFVMYNDFTPNLIELLLKGEIEFFLGTYWQDIREISTIPVFDETYYCVIPDSLLKEKYKDRWQDEKEKLKKGINLKEMTKLPMILPRKESYIFQRLMMHMEQNNIVPNVIATTNSYVVAVDMAKSGYGACFCPTMIAPLLVDLDDGIGAYPIKGLDDHHAIRIAYCKDAYMQKCTRNFIDAIVKHYTNC